MSKILNIIKKILVSSFLIYGFNILAVSLNINIPLNIFTIGYVSILGAPALISLIMVYIFGFR